MKHIYSLSLAIACSCISCGSGSSNKEATQADTQMVAAHIDPSTKFPAEKVQADTLTSDGSFWNTAYTSGQEVMELSVLATKKGGTSAVKKAARTIQQDHQQLLQKLRSMDTTTVKKYAPLNDSSVNELSALSGVAFDKAWLEKMILKNEAAISRYEIEKDATGNKDNRKLATEVLTLLHKHQQLLEAVKGANK